MEAKELRIGNFVNYEGHNSVVTGVIDVPLFGRCVIIGDNEPREKDVYPIPLTEEWLVKLGFEKKLNNEDFDYWVNDHFDDGFLWEHSEGFCYNFSRGFDLKHVHQLQNLYFALTGQELTINEQ